MRFQASVLAGLALVAGLVPCGLSPASAQVVGAVSPRIIQLEGGLFCAPPDGDRRPAPETISGWVHVPEMPVEMIAQGFEAPALLGLGFGVRFALASDNGSELRYTVTHPPMPPTGITAQSWDSVISGSTSDTAFFQFDTVEELQPGDWAFTAVADGEVLFTVAFTVRPPAELPELVHLCRGGPMLSLSRTGHAAAG